MNLRHAAALALVRWYLIVAPPQSFKDGKYHEGPLEEWTHKATFDSEFECSTLRDSLDAASCADWLAEGGEFELSSTGSCTFTF
jgi:hypothetical protein